MRIGPAQRLDRQEPSALYNLLDDGYEGVWGWSGMGLCGEAMIFVTEQCARFGVPLNHETHHLIDAIGTRVLEYADYVNPYVTLLEFSDLAATTDWEQNTYELIEGKRCVDVASPEDIETYTFVPGQAEHWFNEFMSHPGLDFIPRGIGADLTMHAVESFFDYGLREDFEDACKFCGDNLETYLKLFAWATFVWLCGPLGREFRKDFSLLHDVVCTYGEGIIHNQKAVLSPKQYNKIARPYTACGSCGVDAYCTELLSFGDDFKRLCEKCANQGRIIFDNANCGTRFCRYIECPNHLMNSQTDKVGALYNTLRNRGILTQPRVQNLLTG
jgi:hypothetical protein